MTELRSVERMVLGTKSLTIKRIRRGVVPLQKAQIPSLSAIFAAQSIIPLYSDLALWRRVLIVSNGIEAYLSLVSGGSSASQRCREAVH